MPLSSIQFPDDIFANLQNPALAISPMVLPSKPENRVRLIIAERTPAPAPSSLSIPHARALHRSIPMHHYLELDLSIRYWVRATRKRNFRVKAIYFGAREMVAFIEGA